MAGSSVLKRLLWKEVRRSGLPVVALLVLPALLFTVSAQWAPGSTARTNFDTASCAVLTAVLVLWPASLGRRDKRGMGFAESHLAVTPWAEWASSFLVPLLVCALCGLWAGFWSLFPWPNTQPWPDALWFAALWGVAFALVFGGVYLLSAAISEWAGVAAGLVFTFATVMSLLGGRSDLARHAWFWPDAMRAGGEAAIGPVVGMLVFAGLSRKRSLRVRKLAALAIGAGIVLWVFRPLWGVPNVTLFDYHSESYAVLRSENGAQLLEPIYPGTERDARGTLRYLMIAGVRQSDVPLAGSSAWPVVYRYQDFRTQVTLSRKFPHQTQAIGFAGDRVVLVEKDLQHGRAVILLWSPRKPASALRRVTSIPFKRQASVLNGVSMSGCVDPAGRYLLLFTRPSNGTGTDVWVADLKSGRAEVVWPNRLMFLIGLGMQLGRVEWSNHRAVVPGVDWSGPFVVNADEFTAKLIAWPESGRRQQ